MRGGGSDNEAANPYKAIAQARPKPGSVNQSSNTQNGITLDTVTVTPNGRGIDLQNGNKWRYVTSQYRDSIIEDGVYHFNDGFDHSEVSHISLTDWLADGGQSRRHYENIENYGETVNSYFTSSTSNDGLLPTNESGKYIALVGNYRTTDGMAVGNFAISNNPEFTNTRHLAIGAFADGSDPFTQSNIQPLSGTINYSGYFQRIMYRTNSSTDNSSNGLVFGQVNLNADFGDGNDLGSVSGDLSNLTVGTFDRGNDVSGRLLLNAANIGNDHSGFFDGDVTGRLNGLDYTGKWGGQFYNNNRGDGLPGTVAGTAAAESSDGRFVLVTPWMADFNRTVRSALNEGPGYLAPGQSQGSPIDAQTLANSYLNPGAAMGDALGNSIGRQQVTAFSSVPGITFTLNGDSFVGATPGASLAASLDSFMAPTDWAIPEQWRFSLKKPLHVASKHGASIDQGSSLFHLASPQGLAASFHTQGVEVAYQPSKGPFTFTAGTVHEDDSLLGTQAQGIFGALVADTFYVGSRWQTDVGQWSLAASGEVGLVAPRVAGSSVIDGIDTLATNAFSLEAVREFNNGNALRFSLTQPLRVAHGSMAYTLASGSQDRLVTGESYSSSLAPSGRQLDWTTDHGLERPYG